MDVLKHDSRRSNNKISPEPGGIPGEVDTTSPSGLRPSAPSQEESQLPLQHKQSSTVIAAIAYLDGRRSLDNLNTPAIGHHGQGQKDEQRNGSTKSLSKNGMPEIGASSGQSALKQRSKVQEALSMVNSYSFRGKNGEQSENVKLSFAMNVWRMFTTFVFVYWKGLFLGAVMFSLTLALGIGVFMNYNICWGNGWFGSDSRGTCHCDSFSSVSFVSAWRRLIFLLINRYSTLFLARHILLYYTTLGRNKFLMMVAAIMASLWFSSWALGGNVLLAGYLMVAVDLGITIYGHRQQRALLKKLIQHSMITLVQITAILFIYPLVRMVVSLGKWTINTTPMVVFLESTFLEVTYALEVNFVCWIMFYKLSRSNGDSSFRNAELLVFIWSGLSEARRESSEIGFFMAYRSADSTPVVMASMFTSFLIDALSNYQRFKGLLGRVGSVDSKGLVQKLEARYLFAIFTIANKAVHVVRLLVWLSFMVCIYLDISIDTSVATNCTGHKLWKDFAFISRPYLMLFGIFLAFLKVLVTSWLEQKYRIKDVKGEHLTGSQGRVSVGKLYASIAELKTKSSTAKAKSNTQGREGGGPAGPTSLPPPTTTARHHTEGVPTPGERHRNVTAQLSVLVFLTLLNGTITPFGIAGNMIEVSTINNTAAG